MFPVLPCAPLQAFFCSALDPPQQAQHLARLRQAAQEGEGAGNGGGGVRAWVQGTLAAFTAPLVRL